MRQIEGIDPDAVAADHAGTEVQEVPFGGRRFQYVVDRDAEAAEDHRDFVDEGDVDVALGVLDHLGGFRHLDAGGTVDAGAGDGAVDRRQPFRDLFGLAGDHLRDPGYGVFAVAGIDALRGVAQEEVASADQPRRLFQGRAADILGDAGIDGALEHDDRLFRRSAVSRSYAHAVAERRADGAAGRQHRPKVGLVPGVHRRRDGHDVKLASRQFGRVGRQGQGAAQVVRFDLPRAVVTVAQFGDPAGVDVEAGRGEVTGKFDREGQSDIA